MFEKEPYYNEKIEAYLRDELSAGDKAAFEDSLKQDPLLHNEFLLQKDIIASLQSQRKAQLKQRLQQIDVSSLSNGNTGISGMVGLLMAGVVALGIAGWFTFGNTENKTIANESSATVKSQPITVPATGSTSEQKEIPADIAQPTTGKEESLVSVPTKSSVKNNKEQNISSSIPAQIVVVPRLEHPIAKSVDGEPLRHEEAFAGNKLPMTSSSESQRLNVTDNTSSRMKLHYFYQDGQITLLGFDQPYTLLEIQSENIIYLFYEGSFYRLDSNYHKPTPIKDSKVTDPELIKSLQGSLTSRE